MRKMIRNVLMISLFASQVLHIFGKVTILRGSGADRSRKLICVAEDDGSALVWNSNLIWKYLSYSFTDRDNHMQFSDINQFNRTRNIDYGSNTYSDQVRIDSWFKFGWSLTDSLKTPMGPVADRRWEEFKEYVNFDSTFEHVDINGIKPTAISFSFRGSKDAHILFCNSTLLNTDFCYWIIIGGWENQKSVIRKCINGVPKYIPVTGSECQKERVTVNHTSEPLSASEWRSFIITWDFVTRNISVYDINNLIMTFVDTEESSYLKDNFHIFIRSNGPMLMRFHIYKFLHTTNENRTLTSTSFLSYDKTICIELLVGLCAECDAEVVLRHFEDLKVIEIIRVKSPSANTIHRLPMWQSVKITKTLSVNHRVLIQFIPKLNSNSSNPLWAIANIRQCSLNEFWRRGSMLAKMDYDDGYNEYFWPTVTCQKLFYNEHIVVNSIQTIKPTGILDVEDCSLGKIGPQCLFSCKDDLISDYDCKDTSICYENGCTCSSGFFGQHCSDSCSSGTYGRDCEKTCGTCQLETCHKVTGKCNAGCNDSSVQYYIPPFCQISIHSPNVPNIDFKNETSIQVSLPVKNEYRELEIFYTFAILNDSSSFYTEQSPQKKILQNTTLMTGHFQNLIPGDIYHIFCTLHVMQSTLQGARLRFQAPCNPAKDFEIISEETNVIINWRINDNQLYPCPVHMYLLMIRNENNELIIVIKEIKNFPYKVLNLNSYTSFNVTILFQNRHLFSEKIRTLEGVPSSVIDLQVLSTSSTETVLTWKPPERINGKLVKYKIILQIEQYYGCLYLKSFTPKNHTVITSTMETLIRIKDLHPYAHYSAQVIAYNSRHGGFGEKFPLYTRKTEIPTEIFSHLRMEGWKLLWNQPDDCTTISGPIFARIRIRGISDAVKEFGVVTDTKNDYLNLNKIKTLHGAEQYLIKLYVIRDYNTRENASAYIETLIDTPPKAPPKVSNLDVVEIDTRGTLPVATIHLRWQSPLPPLNGELYYYAISVCNSKNINCLNTVIHLNESCDLWDNYICGNILKPSTSISKINVFAYNVNVSEASAAASVTKTMLSNTVPDAPRNYTITTIDKNIVVLTWLHPWITGERLQYFCIRVNKLSSNLKKSISQSIGNETYEYPITDYKRNYSQRLYLFPSTQYVISIAAVTTAHKSSIKIEQVLRMPSNIGFDGDLKIIPKSNSMMLLHIPDVLNDTFNSITHIIVKGPNPCKQYSKLPESLRMLTDVKMYHIAWQAAILSTSKLSGKTFTIGDNKVYGGVTNCPLKVGEAYEIIIMIFETNDFSEESIMLTKKISIFIEGSSLNYEAWLIPVILLLVVITGFFYFYRRKKEKPMKQLVLQDEMVLLQTNNEHETKSVLSNSKANMSYPSEMKSLSEVNTLDTSSVITDASNDKEKEMTLSVKVKDFEDYVKRALEKGLLDKQYETFPRGQTRPWDYGKLPQNKSKNRYANLLAYDETRVSLKKLPNDDYSDYINANYITGYNKQKRYIATQGPKPNTVIDFWRMIWQENVLIICMLANIVESGKTKCEQYWPDIGKKKKYGEIIVHNSKHNVFADYCVRTLDVTHREETRKVKHLHYTAWPDHGVPLYTHSVVTYLKKLLATPPGNGPVIVHCSAGVGRTGTIILCDICLHRAAAEGIIDVFAETVSIRNERANMVDNKQQFLLAHLVLVECLLSIPTTLPCDEMLPIRIKELKNQLTIQQQRLQDTAWQNEALRQVTSQPLLSECNRAKNRFPELISDKASRIYLKRYPPSDEDSDYLSAVYVDGVRLQNQYIATQLPMPLTINDFWRMVAEFKVELILMLQPPDPEDPSCCTVGPVNSEFKTVPYLNITTKEIVEMEHHTLQKLLLLDNSEKPAREQSVTILCSTKWKPGRDQTPPSVMAMVTFWQAAERIARGDGPTVILCHDGVTGCGLYLALSFLLERMAVERECDVCLAVKAIRRSRPDFVRSLEHLEYLYDAATTYLEYFETYANFS